MNFKLTQTSKIYLVCPANHATGGTEVIHQLANKLTSLGFSNTKIYYLNQTHTNPVHENFLKYNTHHTNYIVDRGENLLIVPEIYTDFLYRYHRIQKSIWWLSVDNYLIKRKLNFSFFHLVKKSIRNRKVFLPKKIFTFQSKDSGKILHLYQSEYAKSFLVKNNISIQKKALSDYLNTVFINESLKYSFKKDNILYNPSKGFEFTKKIISKRPDLNWFPIQNMRPQEVQDILSISKIYIDFGHHPGKDRLPREAALSGCCIITGKKGAAANKNDISIPEEYKFDEKTVSLASIISKIEDCLQNYSLRVKDFTEYCENIKKEEQVFEESVRKIFLSEDFHSQDQNQ
ncbi:hypothetical protein E4S40_11150 [Algoriphagus kandeliae]|uniref:Glycosyltransferase family 1 protein n=1 Tax=Algoriphagus kandeliae TaxID=2562278 RepID=A0A4Y9QTT4_9BACT|nr:hypothetical protein [Algoriphagus kandeliae]TFV94566.1 hypothetical protein E4S40_11150 [Algoriphagus kandeliae]